jgi:VanZ family protein
MNTTLTANFRYRKLWLTLGFAMVLAILLLSLLPGKSLPNVPTGDKINHFIAYSSLMLWFSQLFPGRRLQIAIACVAFGAVIEILQPIVSDRYFEGWDNVANAIGVSIGWLLMRTPLRNSIAWVDGKLGR